MKTISYTVLLLLGLVSNAQVKDVLVPYKKASLWGYSDTTGKVKMAAVYDSVTLFKSVYDRTKGISITYSKVYQKDKVGILSLNNTLLFPVEYVDFDFEYDSDRFTITDATGKMGLRDFNTVYLPIEYESIKGVRNDSYVIQKNGKLGLADFTGKIVIPMVYEQLNYVSKDEKLCKWKVVNDQETKYVFTPIKIEDDAMEYATTAGIAAVRDSDNLPKEQSNSKYDWVERNREFDYAFIFRDEKKYPYKYGFMNSKSKNTFKGMEAKIEFLFDYFEETTKSQYFILKMNKSGKVGIIDETGNIIAPPQYDRIQGDRKKCTLIKDDLIGYYFPKSNQLFEAKYQGSIGSQTLERAALPDFEIIGVYENSKKDWYYIGENGVIFKE